MKHTVRAFALGLIVAGVILLGVFYFVDDSNEDIEDITTEELIARVEEEGLRVISEEEYISYSVERVGENDSEIEEEDSTEKDSDDDVEEETEEENEDSEEDEVEEEDEEEESPSTITITVEPGMASSHISDLLEDEGLIDDAEEFNEYLLENDYSLYVRMGEHELETGMSHYEIAEALTN